MNPAEFAINNRLISFIVILGSLFGGWLAYENMARFEDPEFTIRTAQIFTQYPGATPEEVAEEVSEALESAIQQMQEVEEIRSTSSAGLSLLSVDIKYDFSRTKSDLDLVWTKLRNRVRDAQTDLPPGALESVVNDDFGDVYGMYYLITGDGFTPEELHEYAKSLRTELLAVEGVAKVSIGGVQQEVIYVEISRERINALGISITRLFEDLEQQNAVVSAGSVLVEGQRLLLQPSGDIDSVAALQNIVVSTPSSDTVVRLKDVATVERGYIDPKRFDIEFNGQHAISIGVSNVTGANVVKMGQAIDAVLKEEESRRPLGIELNEYYHQGKIVDASVKNFALNVVLALVIVLVTLLAFMGLRSAVVIGLTLVLTIAATLATMYLVDIPMHRISLGALIIALGMLVDNAIVVTEGILVGVQQGIKKLDIAKTVVQKTIWPLLGGTLVGILAFAPIGFAPGSTAEYTNHLFWVILISLSFSWVFAITLVPMLADMLFSDSQVVQVDKGPNRVAVAYRSFVEALLHRRILVVVAAFSLFFVSVWGFKYVKSGFFPASTTPQIAIDYWLPEGTDISVTTEDMEDIQAYLLQQDHIQDVQALIGGGTLRYMLVYAPEPPTASYGQFLIKVTDYNQIAQLIPRIQAHIDNHFPNAQAKVWRFQLGPGGGSKIEAQFSGPDPTVLRDLANQAKAIMAADGGAISIKDDWRNMVPVVTPRYSETRGRRLGVSRETMSDVLRAIFSGSTVGIYREGDDLIPIVTRGIESERYGLEVIESVMIPSSTSGVSVPLLELVDGIETEWHNSRILRVDRQWTIMAQCDPVPTELASDLLLRIKDDIEAIPLPAGYKFKWQGEYGDSAEASGNLFSTIPAGLLAMVLVVVLLFNKVRQPLLIWLVVPLALIGVTFGLVLTGTAMEFMAILGVLSLSGLLIKNAIVLVDQMDLDIREGKARYQAVVDAAISRVRPVMMGSLTTVLGIIPLFNDAFFKSMTVVLAFGLSFATLLTLLVVPALYCLMFGISADEV